MTELQTTAAPKPPTYTVEQGPAWLIDLYLTPPSWVNPLLKIIGIAVVAIVFYRLYEDDWIVDAKTQLAMGRIAGTASSVLVATLAITNAFHQPYLIDVLSGLSAGYGAVFASTSNTVRKKLASRINNQWKRMSAGWIALVTMTLVGPRLANTHGQGMLLFGVQMAVVAIGAGMIILNIAADERQFQ